MNGCITRVTKVSANSIFRKIFWSKACQHPFQFSGWQRRLILENLHPLTTEETPETTPETTPEIKRERKKENQRKTSPAKVTRFLLAFLFVSLPSLSLEISLFDLVCVARGWCFSCVTTLLLNWERDESIDLRCRRRSLSITSSEMHPLECRFSPRFFIPPSQTSLIAF